MISYGPIDSPIIITNANYATVARGMINTRYDELYIRTIFRAKIVGISILTISFGITKRVNTEIHFRLASKLHLIEIYYQLRRAAPLYICSEKFTVQFANDARCMHMNGDLIIVLTSF